MEKRYRRKLSESAHGPGESMLVIINAPGCEASTPNELFQRISRRGGDEPQSTIEAYESSRKIRR